MRSGTADCRPRRNVLDDGRRQRGVAHDETRREGQLRALRGQERLDRQAAQVVEAGARTGQAGVRGHLHAERDGVGSAVTRQSIGALHDGSREQAVGEWRGHQRQHALATGRLSEDRDAPGVAAERFDVVLDPAQRGDLIEKAEIHRAARRRALERRMSEEAQMAQPVVDTDDDHAALRQRGPVVDGKPAAAENQGTAVQPHHHRLPLAAGARCRREDVERETVFVDRADIATPFERRSARLWAGRAVPCRCAGRRPARCRPRFTPAPVSDGWGRVRDAAEGDDAIADRAPHRSAPRDDVGIGVGAGLRRGGGGEERETERHTDRHTGRASEAGQAVRRSAQRVASSSATCRQCRSRRAIAPVHPGS